MSDCCVMNMVNDVWGFITLNFPLYKLIYLEEHELENYTNSVYVLTFDGLLNESENQPASLDNLQEIELDYKLSYYLILRKDST
jgi:hypothetical protein